MSVIEAGGGKTSVDELLHDVIRSLWPLRRTVVRAVERECAATGVTPGQHAVSDELRRNGPRTGRWVPAEA
ncbi:hypothetical protein GCM10010129_82340 [Streptomyces fumigatiscleroticus]|nr:hypothetical protein GCM10010129_82340 [Streptomyces fumigatiscleroticus]